MRNILLRLFISGILICTHAVAARSAGRILLLYSYHPGMLWEKSVDAGITAALKKSGVQPAIHREYMDTKRSSSPRYTSQLAGLYRLKYKKIKPDLIAAVDDAAFRFLLKYRGKIFGRTPVVFCGVNFLEEKDLLGKKGYTGVVESFDVAGTIRLIRKLQPGIKQLYVINDNTLTGKLNSKRLNESRPLFPKLKFIRLNGLSMEELCRRLGGIQKKSAVLLMSFNRDRTGKQFTYRQSIFHIRPCLKVPLYGFWDFYLNRGIVGGSITMGRDQGAAAGEMILKILSGQKAGSIPIRKKGPVRTIIDYREAAAYGLNTAVLPTGTRFINRPDSSIFLNRQTIFLFLGLLLLLIMAALTLLIRLRKQTAEGKTIRKKSMSYRLLSRFLENRVLQRTSLLIKANEDLQCSLEELEREAEAARKIQFRMLPSSNFLFGGIQFRHMLLPSKYVSGDFIDYFKLDENRTGFYTADVSGHGLSAAFITVFLKGQIDLQLEKFHAGTESAILNPSALLQSINKNIREQNLGKHISIFYAVLDNRNSTLLYSNAGQFPFPLYITPEHTEILEMKQPPTGLFKTSRYVNRTLNLAENFSIIFCSDGILEAFPRIPLQEKEERLLKICSRGEVSLESISEDLSLKNSNQLPDDISILHICRRKG